MIVRLNKEKTILIAAMVVLGIVVAWYAFGPKPTEEGVSISARARGYFPGELNQTSESRDYAANQSGGRISPFLSTSVGVGQEIEIPLPDIITAAPVIAFISPLPGPPYNLSKLGRLPLNDSKEWIKLPEQASLSSIEDLESMIETIAPIEEEEVAKPSPDYREEDTLTLKNGTKIPGRYVETKNGKVFFVPKHGTSAIEYDVTEVMEKNIYKTTREQYEEQLKNVSPTSAEGYYRLAFWCLDKSMDVEAVKALETAIGINNAELKYYLMLAELYASRMDMEKELHVYQSGLNSPVVNKEVFHEKLGDLFERMGLSEEALVSYDSAITKHPFYASAWVKIGDYHLARRSYDQALSCYQRALESNPDNAAFQQKIGVLEFRKGNFPKAAEILKNSGDFTNISGVMSLLSGEYQDAIKYFEETIKNSLKDRSDALSNLAYIYLLAGKKEEAKLLLQESAKHNPASPTPFIGLGYLNWVADDFDEALVQFNQAISIAPNNFFAYYSRGQMYFAQRKIDLARNDFLYCLDNNSSFHPTLYYLGLIAFMEKRYPDALNYFSLYMKQIENPNSNDYVNMAVICAANRQFEKSSAMVQKANSIRTDYVPAINCQAYLEFTVNNNKEQTIKLLEKAMTIASDDNYAGYTFNLIKRASSLVVWVDRFDRPNNDAIGKGWTENEKYGIQIALSGQRCIFSGKQALFDNGITSLEKLVNKVTFVKLEVEFETLSKDRDRAEKVTGFYIADQNKKGMLFVANRNNRLYYGISKKADTPPDWKLFENNIPLNPTNYKIAVEKFVVTNQKGKATEEYRCYYNDEPIGTLAEKEVDFFRSAPTSLVIGVFGYAPIDKKWEMTVKNIRVFEERPK